MLVAITNKNITNDFLEIALQYSHGHTTCKCSENKRKETPVM